MTKPFGGGLRYERDLVSAFEARGLAAATGRLRLVMGREGRPRQLFQGGGLRLRFPHVASPDWPEAVLINTAGGVVGGDELSVAIEVEAGARLCVSTAAAEKYYRAASGKAPARVMTRLAAEAGSVLEWLPQESIYFDGCRLDRTLAVRVAADAQFIGVETVLWGRRARGEVLDAGDVRERVIVEREGEMLLFEPTRLDRPIAARLAAAARAAGAVGTALLLYAAPDAEARLETLRTVLAPWPLCRASAPTRGFLAARLLAASGRDLRDAVEAGLAFLREGRALPRLWKQ